jgi:hypothetical protein
VKGYDWVGILFTGFLIFAINFIYNNQDFTLTLVIIGVVFWLVRALWTGEAMEERRAHRRSRKIYRTVRKRLNKYRESYDGDDDRRDFMQQIHDRLPELSDELHSPLLVAAGELYDWEYFDVLDVAKPPPISNSIEGARYREQLNLIATRVESAPRDRALAIAGFVEAFNSFLDLIPFRTSEGQVLTTVSIAGLDKTPKALEAMVMTFFRKDYCDAGVFEQLRDRLQSNLNEQDDVFPSEYKGDNLGWDYLKDTPLLDILSASVPYVIDPKIRFEHMHICAPPGTGKTNLIKSFLAKDLDKVAKREASVIVMESNVDLINELRNSARFAPGGDLEGRLVYIGAEFKDHPISINLFDLGGGNSSERSLLEYIFRSVIGSELTPNQTTLFRQCVKVMSLIPQATLDDFLMLLNDESRYDEYITQLDDRTREFFTSKYSQDFKNTRSQVANRIYSLLGIEEIAAMITAPTTKLDMYKELGDSKVILVNAARSVLGSDGTEMFGRIFTALTLAGLERRQFDPVANRQNVYFYVDECHDFYKYDEKIEDLLAQARKLKCGMVLAHQDMSQLVSSRAAFAAHPAIKWNMDLPNLPDFTFSLSVRRGTPMLAKAPVTNFKLGDVAIDMTEMWEKYSYTPGSPTPVTDPEPPQLEDSSATIPKEWG